ncbi:MAG: GntR family transcriptional regulator [Acidimicrobiales bacterium]
MRDHRYRLIADDLRRRVEAGEFARGRLLPSEATLGAAYGASRITVRRALDVLRDEKLVASRQGFGWYVATEPVRQTLARLGTIEDQLAESGRRSERRVIGFRFVTAKGRVREVLGAGTVLEVRRVNTADGEPFARVTVWCPERYGRGLSRDAVEASSFYELVPVELGGATQTIAAGASSAADAELLGVPAGSPVLVCERVTRSSDGEPVLLSDHVFPAHLTEFVVDLPYVDVSIAPNGLRLVEQDS